MSLTFPSQTTHPYVRWLRETMLLPADHSKEMPNLERLYNGEMPERPIVGFDLKKTLKALDIEQVPYNKAPVTETDGTHGWSSTDGGKRRLALTRATQFPMAVYWHEIAHILLGHCDMRDKTDLQTAANECEAEMTAYILENVYSYNEAKAKSRAYIQTWANRGVNLKALNYQAIYKAVNQIKEINQ